jgi:hypothetical protein
MRPMRASATPKGSLAGNGNIRKHGNIGGGESRLDAASETHIISF